MIDFFEFLNGCSPLRATSYMGFILIFTFITYAFVEGIIFKLVNGSNSKKESETKGPQQLND